MDLVSVIIPTIRRPETLRRAIASVFGQTWTAVEVIVMIDGPDPATRAVLATFTDPRLTVLCNEYSRGPGIARNAAAQTARGVWLAFLDDDDEWLPEKLERQLAGVTPDQPVVLSCRCLVETSRATHLWPRRLPRPDEPVDSYLFERRSLLRGEAYLATPTIVMPAWLFHRTGFGTTWQHEDTTLLLRATRLERASIIMRPEVLTIIHVRGAGTSLGSDFSWQDGLAWLETVRDLFTPRGCSGFCLVTLGSQAARVRDWQAIPILLRHAWSSRSITILQLLLFMTFWMVPQDVRQRFRATRSRRNVLKSRAF
jgi:hypothetical protein